MVTSMIPNVNNVFKNPNIIDMRFLSANIPYNPLINYDWSTTTTSGLRYLKDVGSTPIYNASMYFGRGAYLNGVDQTITVPINTTIQTSLKRVNGIVTINETSQTLTNYVISGLGVHKDYYLFTRLLTTTEKDSYINTPELFYAMAQTDSTCVLNMPMCETDGYVRNMKSYNKGVERTQNVNITTAEYLINSGETTVANNALRIYSSAGAWSSAINNNVLLLNTEAYYLIEFNVSIITIQGNIKFAQFGTANEITITPFLGKNLVVLKASSVTYDDLVIGRVSGAVDVTISSISVKQLSGTYAITNYTSSVRDNAKNLQYGLQTCKFVRNSLGVIQSASDYLECDGVGYGDTGWIPDGTKDMDIEFIVTPEQDGIPKYCGIWTLNSSTFAILGSEFNGSLRIDIGNLSQRYINSNGVTPIHVVIQYKASGTYSIYRYGVPVQLNYAHNYVANTKGVTFELARALEFRRPLKQKLRLFKVHTEPQDPLELYNKAVSKGLLS